MTTTILTDEQIFKEYESIPSIYHYNTFARAIEQAVLKSKEISQLRIEAAAGFSSVGHLCALLDTQTEILNDAMAVMKALHESAKPIDESKGNFDARIPAGAYRRFVDDHARLLHEIAICQPAVKQEQVVMEFAEKVTEMEKQP